MKIQETTTRTAADLQVKHAQAARVDTGAAAPKDAAKAAKAQEGAGPAATVSLSSRGREIQSAMAQANAAPDVRADKVAEVKSRLQSGTYVIDPTRIARGILDSSA